jgi:uncharacterized protein (TIGR00369 family)
VGQCRRAGAPGEAAHSGNAPARPAAVVGCRRPQHKPQAQKSTAGGGTPRQTAGSCCNGRLISDAPWRGPVRGGYPDPRHFGLGGADQLRAMLAGKVPNPPISRLTGMRLMEIGEGCATFQMPLTKWLCAPQGVISIGPLAMPADGAVACAIQTLLPPATPFTTSELSLRLLAPVPPTGSVTARGKVIQLRRRIALAEVAITDEDEQLVAHGSSLCFVQPAISPAPDPRSAGNGVSAAAVVQDAPDPYARSVQGEVLGQDVWTEMSGLEVLRAQLAGELPWPPIHHLTGLTLDAASCDETSFTMPASEWLCAPARARVQGGAVALLAESALSSAIQTKLAPGTALAPIDLKVNYLRPLAADGRRALARGRVVHAGRRIAVASADVVDADGKPVAVATGSAMMLPDRPASLATGES